MTGAAVMLNRAERYGGPDGRVARMAARRLPRWAGGSPTLCSGPTRMFRLQFLDCLGNIIWRKSEVLVQLAERQVIYGDEPNG